MAAKKETMAQWTAAAMRKEILALGADGQFFGSEDDLLVRYGVSRPTLRQAARILEHEQLLTVRRGVNGGLFTRLPTSQAVSHVAAVFLQANGTTVHELFAAVTAIAPVIARMAAENPSAEERHSLLSWVESQRADVGSMRPRAFLMVIAEFGRRLAALADSPPLTLFENVLLELAAAESTVNVFAVRERIGEVYAYQLDLARAVVEGNADRAELLARGNGERTAHWINPPPRRMNRT